MGRRRNLPLIENLEIIDVAAEGKSIAKYNNLVVFVPGLVPGDIADVQIVRKKRNFMEGFLVNLKKSSPLRVQPFCKHFGVCGGCKWQNMPYSQQLVFKQKQVVDNLTRIGKVALPEIKPIIGAHSDKFYRNKLEFTFSQSRWLEDDLVKTDETIDKRALGFHIPGKFDRILNIETCYLQDDFSNEIRNAIREFTMLNNYTYFHQRNKFGLLRNLMVRNTTLGEWMLVVVFFSNAEPEISALMEYIKIRFPQLTSLMYIVNEKVNDTIHDQEVVLFSGRDHIFEQLGTLTFKIGPKSFFQTNTSQALALYRTTLEFAGLTGNEVVYDLYTGTGTIANFIAKHAKKVIGIEYVEDAISDAHENSKINNLHNLQFFAGDMKDILTEDFIATHGQPDVIISDPPRAGMHPDVVDTLLKAAPQRIVYVSCNPATQARDIQLLAEMYDVTAIQPVDMFPHTHHVENVVCLTKKK